MQNDNWRKQKVYYWNARLNGKTALLSGPFLTAKDAEASADHVSPVFLIDQPQARNATFGVMECNAPGVEAEKVLYNHHLPAHIYRNLAVGIRLQ